MENRKGTKNKILCLAGFVGTNVVASSPLIVVYMFCRFLADTFFEAILGRLTWSGGRPFILTFNQRGCGEYISAINVRIWLLADLFKESAFDPKRTLSIKSGWSIQPHFGGTAPG